MYLNIENSKLVSIVENNDLLGKEPLVSVVITAYNHQHYIVQAIESVLEQNTDFDYEVVIAEDKSTDGTSDIVLDLQRRYPEKIRLRIARENLYSQGMKPWLVTFPACRGEYIALLEGDDYWIDDMKLQKQVNYLEAHSKASGCFTDCRIVNETGAHVDRMKIFPCQYLPSYDQRMCLTMLASAYGTASLMFRKSVVEKGLPDFFLQLGSDYLLDLVITENGNLDYLPELTSVYRLQAGGIWQGESPIQNCLKKILRLNALGQSPHMMNRYARDLEHMWLNEMCIYGERSASEKASISDAIESIENLNNELRDSPFRHLVKKCGVKYLVRNWNNLGASGKTLTQRLAWLLDATVRSPRLAPACCRFLFKLMEVRFKHAKL
jgi:glycosyltransferase involved in cell wall biosynthesis